MSWLEDDVREFMFLCPQGHEHIVEAAAKASPGPGSKNPCPECGEEATYNGLVPIQLGGMTAVEGEQNGRKYVEYNDGRGKVRRVSKTKLEYLRTGKTGGVYTKAFKEHMLKAQVSSAAKGALKE